MLLIIYIYLLLRSQTHKRWTSTSSISPFFNLNKLMLITFGFQFCIYVKTYDYFNSIISSWYQFWTQPLLFNSVWLPLCFLLSHLSFLTFCNGSSTISFSISSQSRCYFTIQFFDNICSQAILKFLCGCDRVWTITDLLGSDFCLHWNFVSFSIFFLAYHPICPYCMNEIMLPKDSNSLFEAINLSIHFLERA